jgi:methionine-rich copper-binding protein CopC
MKLKHILVAAALTLIMPGMLLAHDEEKGPNGGPVVDAAGHHVEFVNEGADLSFFLSDEGGKPIASKGAKARAVIQDQGKTQTVPLTNSDPNKLIGNLSQPLKAGTRVVFSATMADGHSIQARFVKN